MKLVLDYDKFKQTKPSRDLEKFREEAYQRCVSLGLPSRKLESWKYTSLKSLSDLSWRTSVLNPAATNSADHSFVKKQLDSGHLNLVFVNGRFASELSSVMPKGVSWKEVNSAPKTNPDEFFESLQAAFFVSRHELVISENVSVSQPIQIFFYQNSKTLEGQFSQTHLTVTLAKAAQAEIVETFFGDGDAVYMTNALTKFELAQNSTLKYLRVQKEGSSAFHFGKTVFSQAQSSNLESLNLTLGAKLSRTFLGTEFIGKEASAKLLGTYLGRGHQHLDHQTEVSHRVGHGTSFQLYKGLLDDHSRAVFNGRVMIEKNAQKAFSEQLNNNLLLSRDAEADSKPQLEIYADDVKATHGSTVGQLQADELFYLLSRAIPKPKAVEMLSFGFAAQTLENFSSEKLKALASAHLKKAFLGLGVKS